jgi:GT2 family glycosyltransferase
MSVKCINLAKENTKLPFELIVVETCSDHLKDLADIHIYEKDRVGPTKSMNRGFSVVGSEYTALLTNDVFVSDGWLEALIEPFDRFANCGISTLGSTQFGHQRDDKIEEGNWFSVACWKTCGPIFDEQYNGVWDDTDFIMRTYAYGKKFYRNFASIAEHLVGATHYGLCGHDDRYERGRQLFIEKWKHLDGTPNVKKYMELAGI